MALSPQQFCLSNVSIHPRSLCQAFPRRYLFVRLKRSRFLPLRNSPAHSSQRASPVFFPIPLEGEDDDDNEEEEETEKEDEEEELAEDHHFKFLDSSAPGRLQDPKSQGTMLLLQNHNSSSHLVYDIDTAEETEIDFDAINTDFQQCVKKGRTVFDHRDTWQGIVGEVVHIARNLPENLALGEALRNYMGRINDRECLEVLRILVEEDLVLNSLKFFEWMKLQEPSSLTPRACTLLFPVLGRAKMGDKLMALFENLPCREEFRDVHVYNATISGLMYGGR